MELDDLKKEWQQSDQKQPSINKNIMDIIQHKTYGPLSALKSSFRRQMIAMTVVPVVIVATNLPNIDKMLSSVLFWCYIVFCIGVVVFARLNYAVVKKMEVMDGRVKSNLEQQISILETRLRQNITGIRITLLFFIALTEILPYFQDFKMLNTWHSLSPFIRFGAYALLFLLQIFLSRTVTHQKFGRHIAHLKELVKEMQ
jgi:hypothetical protein